MTETVARAFPSETLKYIPDEATRTKHDRISAVEQAGGIGTTFLVIGYDDVMGNLHGEKGVLLRIDRTDSRLTFYVKIDSENADVDGLEVWVHDLFPITPTTTDGEVSEEDRLRAELNRLQTRFDRFKQDVREKAIKVAADENWCRDGLNDALTQLGLDTVDDPAVRFDIVIRVTGTGKSSSSHRTEESWIRDSIRTKRDVEQAIENDLTFDSDWSEFRVDDFDWTIENAEESEDD